jgi:hypothetical protein
VAISRRLDRMDAHPAPEMGHAILVDAARRFRKRLD